MWPGTLHGREPEVANRKKTARNFAEAKKVAIGDHKVSDGGYDRHKDGKSGWNADVGGRFHPGSSDMSGGTEYAGPQSTSYSRSTRTKVAFEPSSYILAASAGASLGGSLKGSLAGFTGRRIARYAPVAGGMLAAGLIAAGHLASRAKKRRRNRMFRNWASTGVPSYSSRIR